MLNHFLLLLTLATGAATTPSADVLPPHDSALHPSYTFEEIDPQCYVYKLYLDIEHDRGILPTDPDPKDKCFLDAVYSKDEHSKPFKEIIFYPSGNVFSETDNHLSGVDFIVKGDIYTRAFTTEGTICYFDHFHDGKCVEGFSVRPDGVTERVTNGGGTLSQPATNGKWARRFFGDGGEELIHVEGKDVYLRDSAGFYHRSPDESEEVVHYDSQTHQRDEWKRDSAGKITHADSDANASTPDELKAGFARQREQFFTHLTRTAKAAGFKLRDMGVAQDLDKPTTLP